MSQPRLRVTTEMLFEMSSMQRKSSIRNYLHRFPLFRSIHPFNQHKHTSIPIKSCTKLKLKKLKKRGVLRHTRTYAVASLKKARPPVRSKKGKETGIIVLFEKLVGANRALKRKKRKTRQRYNTERRWKTGNWWSSWFRAQRRRVGD